MFIARDDIKNAIKKIIVDDIADDIVYIVANRGFGKLQLLKGIYDVELFNPDIIVADGASVPLDSKLKSSFIQGIYKYLLLHNNCETRQHFYDSVRDFQNDLPSRIIFIFKRKFKIETIISMLSRLDIETLRFIYIVISNNTPLLISLNGICMPDSDRNYIMTLGAYNRDAKITYVIAVRPDFSGIRFISNVVEHKTNRVWICPVLPHINCPIIGESPLDTVSISLNGINKCSSYLEFKMQALKHSDYFKVFELATELLNSGVKPYMIYVLANQEIDINEFIYIQGLTNRLYHESASTHDDKFLLHYNGKLLWMDTLAYYFVLNEGIDHALRELQKFYFEFLLNAGQLIYNKEDKNKFYAFAKRMSDVSENQVAPGFSLYFSKFSDWIRIFTRHYIIRRDNWESMVTNTHKLDDLLIKYSTTNLNALMLIYNETNLIEVLDVGLKIIGSHFQTCGTNSSEDQATLSRFFKTCLEEAYKWNDLTLMNELIQAELCLKRKGLKMTCQFSALTQNKTMFRYLSYQLSNEKAKIGDIIMSKKTIFLSYTGADQNVVNIIDTCLQEYGYTVNRDLRDIDDWTSIDNFMKSIRTDDFVIPIISDTYLRKVNCMYEVSQLIKDESYKTRTLPVVINVPTSEKISLYDLQYHPTIVRYWQDEAQKYKEMLEKIDRENSSELDMKYRVIKSYPQVIAEFMKLIIDGKNPGIRGNRLTAEARQAAEKIDNKINEFMSK